MKLARIQIETTNAILGLRTTNAKLDIEQPSADLSIRQPEAEINIKTTDSKLLIDSTEVRADLDMKSVKRRVEDFAAKGYQGAMEGIKRRVQEGRMLMEIGKNGNKVIQQIAKNKTNPRSANLGIKFIPNPLKLKKEYVPGSINIDVKTHEPIIDVKINKPIVRYTPGKVTGVMEQWNSVQYDVIV